MQPISFSKSILLAALSYSTLLFEILCHIFPLFSIAEGGGNECNGGRNSTFGNFYGLYCKSHYNQNAKCSDTLNLVGLQQWWDNHHGDHIFHCHALSKKGARPIQNWQKNGVWDYDSMVDLSRAAWFFTILYHPTMGIRQGKRDRNIKMTLFIALIQGYTTAQQGCSQVGFMGLELPPWPEFNE